VQRMGARRNGRNAQGEREADIWVTTVARSIKTVTATVSATTVATMVHYVGDRDVDSHRSLGAYMDPHLVKQQKQQCEAGTALKMPPAHHPAH